jgi:hypothetical protein
MMEAVHTSETSINFEIHGAISQKTALFDVVPVLK